MRCFFALGTHPVAFVSIRAGAAFDQCHAGERSTGGKEDAT